MKLGRLHPLTTEEYGSETVVRMTSCKGHGDRSPSPVTVRHKSIVSSGVILESERGVRRRNTEKKRRDSETDNTRTVGGKVVEKRSVRTDSEPRLSLNGGIPSQ